MLGDRLLLCEESPFEAIEHTFDIGRRLVEPDVVPGAKIRHEVEAGLPSEFLDAVLPRMPDEPQTPELAPVGDEVHMHSFVYLLSFEVRFIKTSNGVVEGALCAMPSICEELRAVGNLGLREFRQLSDIVSDILPERRLPQKLEFAASREHLLWEVGHAVARHDSLANQLLCYSDAGFGAAAAKRVFEGFKPVGWDD